MRIVGKKSVWGGALLGLFLMLLSQTPVLSEAVFLKGTAYKSGISHKEVTIGMSELLVANEPIRRVAITDPSIADVRILSDTSALIRGKRVGKTSMIVWEGKDEDSKPQRFDLTVKRDLSELISSLKALDPSINIDYVVITNSEVGEETFAHNGAYTSSFSNAPQQVGEPAPSLVVNHGKNFKEGAAAGKSGKENERLVLTGKVKSGEVIAKAMAIAMLYMGETSTNIKITTRSGGVLVDEVSQLLSPSVNEDATELGDDMKFAANLKGNLGNGSIITSDSGKVVSLLELEDKVQIAVKVRFYEVKKDSGKYFRSKVSYKGSQSSRVESPANYNDRVNVTSWLNMAASVANGVGGAWALFPKLDLFAYIQALESMGAAKVLAEPTIVVMNGEPGKFRVGGEIPVQESNVSGTGTVSNKIKYIPYGISLNLLPTITENDSILMNVRAQTKDVDESKIFTSGGSGSGNTNLSAPSFTTRKVTTQVEMDPSQALILGGLIKSSSSQSLSKLPVLGDLPILGTLLRSKDFQKDESELVVILCPEVVRAGNYTQMNKPLALESQIHDNNYYIVPDGSELGRRTSVQIQPGLLLPPKNGPADLRRPSTMTDLDNIYR